MLSHAKYLDWVEKYVRPDGLIVGDTFPFGAQQAVPVMREFNRKLSDQQSYHSILMARADGTDGGAEAVRARTPQQTASARGA